MNSNKIISLLRSDTCPIHGNESSFADMGNIIKDGNERKVNCTCMVLPPPPSGPLKRQTCGGGICRTLTDIEEKDEAFKASIVKGKNPSYQPPRDAWFWSSRVEAFYQEYLNPISTNQLFRSGNCNPYCNCSATEKCGDWIDERQFFPPVSGEKKQEN